MLVAALKGQCPKCGAITLFDSLIWPAVALGLLIDGLRVGKAARLSSEFHK